MSVDFLLGVPLNNGLVHLIANTVSDSADWTGKKCPIKDAFPAVSVSPLTSSTHINQVKELKGRFQRPRCLFTIDLWNSTRPPKPVSGSIQALPSLDVNQANAGTWSLQEVAHDNILWVRMCVCVCVYVCGVVSSFLFLHAVCVFFLSLESTHRK